MNRATTLLLLSLTMLALAVSVDAEARSSVSANAAGSALVVAAQADASPAQSNGVSLSEAVQQVRRQYGGQILSAETTRSGNREVHVIKVLTSDNKVKTVRINGRRLNNRS